MTPASAAPDLREAPAVARPIWRRRWVQNVTLAAIAVIGAYALIYNDVVSRARDAYNQGERHMAWYRDPALKKKYFDDKLAADKASVDADWKSKKLSDAQRAAKIEALEFDHDFALSESSVKYAYQWYKDAYTLFSPPESRWTRLARERAPEALALWKQELRAQNVPFEDSMFE